MRYLIAVVAIVLCGIGCGGAPAEEVRQQHDGVTAYVTKYVAPKAKLIATSCLHRVPNQSVATRTSTRTSYSGPNGGGFFSNCTSAITNATTVQGRALASYSYTGDSGTAIVQKEFATWITVPDYPAVDVGQNITWFFGVRGGSTDMYIGGMLQYGPSAINTPGPLTYLFYPYTQHPDGTVLIAAGTGQTAPWSTQPGNRLYLRAVSQPGSFDWYVYMGDQTAGRSAEFTDSFAGWNLFDLAATSMIDSGVSACNQYPSQDYIHIDGMYGYALNPSGAWVSEGSKDMVFGQNGYPCGFYGWGDDVYGWNSGIDEIGWHAEW